MIKKLRYLCTLLLIAVASTAWADEETVVFADQGYGNGEAIERYEGDAFTITFDKGTNNNAPKYYTTGTAIRLYGSNTFTVSSSYTITGIAFTFSSGEGTNEITSDKGTYSDNQWTGSENSVTFTIGGTTGHRRLASVKVTYVTGGKPTPTVLIGESTLNIGETTDVTTNGPALTLVTSDENVASVLGTTITGVSAGTATITATWDEDDDFLGGTKDFTVTVVDPNAPGTEGNPYTVAQAIAAINALEDGGYSDSEVYVSGIISGIKSLDVSQWERAQYFISDDGTEDNQLLVYNGYYLEGKPFTANDQIKAGDEVVVFGKLQKYVKDQVVTPEIAQNNKIVSLNRPSGKASAELSFTPATASVELGDEFTAPTLNNPHELTVTYSSSNEDVATVDASTGDVLILDIGETTITATFAGNDEYEEGSASYTLTVTDPNAAGSSANPYTVAQARAAIDAGNGVTGVYAKGKVSKIVTAYNSQYGNISYNISDDGTETADQLQAYRGKSYNGDNFTSADDIKVGDEVVIYGNLKKHNDTYEFDAGNQLVSLTRPETPVTLPVPTFSPAAGEVEAGTTVTINIEEDENVDYVLYKINDGEWLEYSDDTVIIIEGETTVSARAIGVDGSEGDVANATYTIKVETLDYAVLPFEWEGGAKADFEALDGVTTYGLGGDYGESHAPYLIKLDGTGDFIMVKTDSQPGKVTIGVKMIGGGNTSSITVQGSVDGETFTDIETLTISGAQNAILTLETVNTFAADVRYVKLVFTKGSNVGVGPITIAKPSTETAISVENVELEAEATSGEIAYRIINPVVGTSLTADSETEWISNIVVDEENSVVNFNITANEGDERTGVITLSYGSLTKDVTITQAKYIEVGEDKYELVTDASILKANDEILIAYVDEDGAFVMGEQTSNNRKAVEATDNHDGTITPNSDAQVVKLEGNAQGWYFNVDTGYLYAAGGNTNNYLRTETEIDQDGNAMAIISIEDNDATIVFQGTSERNLVRFNPNSSNKNPLFSCYASTSTTGFLPQIYRKVTSTLKGDVNGDKKVDVADVTALVNALKNGEEPAAGDIDGENGVNAEDVKALVEIILSNQ